MNRYSLFQKYLVLTILALFVPGVANAMFPTFDAGNVKNTIETNINIVKQSKEIQKVKEMSGKINSSIGSATSSISKFKSENLAKIQEKAEKIKKEKERIEKKKAELEKIKKDVEEQKKKIDDAKARAEKYKQEMDDMKNKATSTVRDASSTVKDTSSLAKTGVGTVTSTAGSTFGVSDELSTVQSQISSSGNSTSNASNYINSNDKYYAVDEQFSGGSAAEYAQEVQQPASVSSTRTSFGSASKSVASVKQEKNIQAVKASSAPVVEQQAVSSSGSVQAARVANPVTQSQSQKTGQSQGNVQKAVVVSSQGSSANVARSSASRALVSSQGVVASGEENTVQVSNGDTTQVRGTNSPAVSAKKAYTKPKVTYKAYYNDLNLISKRKSVMGAQTKPVNSRFTGEKATQAKDLTGRASPTMKMEDSSESSDKDIEEDSATSSVSASQSGGAFFSDDNAETDETIVDENGEVVEADEVVETERFIPVQKPTTKTNLKGRRVPFGAKVSPEELEKELKALEAEEALEKKTDDKKSEKQSFKFSENLVFAQLSGATDVGKVYDNYIEGKFALSSKLVNRCKKDAKELADVEVLKTCIAEFVACIYDPNEGTAKACRDEFNEILSDQALNTLAIAMEKKNTTASFEEKVVEKNAKDAAAAKDERADLSVGAAINESIVTTINESTDMLTMQVILLATTGIKDIKPNDLDVVVEENAAESGE